MLIFFHLFLHAVASRRSIDMCLLEDPYNLKGFLRNYAKLREVTVSAGHAQPDAAAAASVAHESS